MKVLPFILSFCLLGAAAFGRETAYKALRAFGTERGQALLSRVVEVQGRAGTPQPATWKIIFDDPSARGGVREVEIQNSQIVAEHTPLRLYGGVGNGAVMDFQKLSLDSEGAFKVANMEAQNAQFGFDSLDYTLRVADDSNSPVWAIQFLDDTQKPIGSIQIAADSGNVLARNFAKSGRTTSQPTNRPPAIAPKNDAPPSSTGSPDPASDPAQIAPDPAPSTVENTEEEPSRRPRIGHEIKKGFLNAGAAMEEFFTGKRTLDRKYREPQTTPPSYRGDD